MTIADYEGVHDLWKTIRGFAIRSIDDSKEGVERFLKRNRTASVVAVEDGKIVGSILCGHDGRRGCLYHVCVHENYRMQGIGKSMVVHCMKALEEEKKKEPAKETPEKSKSKRNTRKSTGTTSSTRKSK